MVVRWTRRLVGRLWRGVRRLVLIAILVVLGLVLAGRWVNPPTTWLMASEQRRLGAVAQDWVPISAMSDDLPLSAAAAEDVGFCAHWGFDVDGIKAALADTERLRGGSTISQQVAKNVFLWPARSWVRKGLEAGLTVLIELAWPKRRIIEVYLNVAEFDEGVFGVQAAAQRYWGLDPRAMGPQRSARLMAVLPDPKRRSPVSGTRYISSRGAAIQSGAETLRKDGRAACFL